MAKPNSAKHKIDHHGDYVMLPASTLACLLAANYPRALAVLLAIQSRFNGWNNGRIGASMREVGRAIGSTDNVANAMAISWLEQAGFIWIARTYAKGSRKAREYGLTYASSDGGSARHTYLHVTSPSPEAHRQAWKLAHKRGWERHTEEPSSVLRSGTQRKQTVWKDDTELTEKSHSCPSVPVSGFNTHILCHPKERKVLTFPSSGTQQNTTSPFASGAGMELHELRSFARSYLGWAGAGAQSRLANSAGVPGGSLSKFLAGRGLAAHHRMNLQLAVGRAWPISGRGAAA